VLPLQVVDFNFDRFNDLILVARDGIYGYVQVRLSGVLMPDVLIPTRAVAYPV